MTTFQHSFDHNGRAYSIHAALVTDSPAVYAIEVFRDRADGSLGEALVSITLRSDYDHKVSSDAMPIEQAMLQGEEIIRSMYL